jgi:hypothetical protein
MTTTGLLIELNRRRCEVLTDGEDLVIRYNPATHLPESLVSELRTRKEELLCLLAHKVEIINCPGNDCAERIMLIDGQGYCNRDNMTVAIVGEIA